MNSAIKLICLFLLVIQFKVAAQDELKHQYQFALNLFDKENYFDAITELKRLLYFDKKGEYRFEANFKIGESYKYGAKLDEAVRFFTFSKIAAVSREDYWNAEINIIRCNILRRTIPRALELLNVLENDSLFAGRITEVNYWRGWAYIFNDQWEIASEEFAKSEEGRPLSIFTKQVDDSLYSVNTARILSFILPGAGQFYTGNYVSGAVSLAWNALWGYITIEAFVENRIFDGFVVGNLLWFRFYRGSIENAENYAAELNRQIINRALNYLQYEFSGIKP